METAVNLLPSHWKAIGTEGANSRSACPSSSWEGSRFLPHPEVREEEQGLCVKAEYQMQLSVIFLLTIQSKVITIFNYFLVQAF